MASIRTFIAIETPLDIRKKISALQNELKQVSADVRWESEDKFHATVKFLGNVEENLLPSVFAVIESVTHKYSHCNVVFEGLGCFPNAHQPRVIWVGCSNPDGRLSMIKTMLDTELRPLGFEIEHRTFKLHITLGRVKSTKNISHLTSTMEKLTFEPQQCTISEVVCMKSMLKPQGSVYSVLNKFQLTK